jgi:predicted nucleotidyltransferase
MIKFESLPADILSRIPEVKRVLAEDDTIVFAYIFGGLAEGKVKPLSDLDIAVYIRDTSDLAEYKINLFGRIANSIGTSELDLIILNTASISITGRILQKKQILIDKYPTVRHTYESLTLRKFFDFKVKEEKFFSLRYGIGR